MNIPVKTTVTTTTVPVVSRVKVRLTGPKVYEIEADDWYMPSDSLLVFTLRGECVLLVSTAQLVDVVADPALPRLKAESSPASSPVLPPRPPPAPYPWWDTWRYPTTTVFTPWTGP